MEGSGGGRRIRSTRHSDNGRKTNKRPATNSDLIETVSKRIPQTITTTRWDCHAHHSGDCSMAYVNGVQYHVIPVKEVSLYTQTRYNKSTDVGISNNEFWEAMPNTSTTFMTPVANCDLINDYNFARKIFLKYSELDSESVVYTRYGSASDMVKRHVLTDCLGNIALCNKHLIRPVVRKEPQIKYTSAKWERQTLKALFPKAMSTAKNNIPTSTQTWVLDILKSSTRSSN